MARIAGTLISVGLLMATSGVSAWGQSPSGPLPPKPGAEVQLPPKNAPAQVKVRVALVNTPVTVRNSRGDMVHDLEAGNFKVTDNGVAQQISHFDLGGDPISLAILIETSSRIEPLLPQIRKTGIVLTQTVMGSTGEAAVVGFDDGIDKLQDFTSNGDLVESTITHLKEGTSGSKLYDAMAVGAVQHAENKIKDHALEVAATATGGAHLATFKDRSIEKAIDEIGGELHSQYTISYTPAGSDATGYHEIKVNVLRNDAKNLKVRARPGYYLAVPES